jgi:predicted peptidase
MKKTFASLFSIIFLSSYLFAQTANSVPKRETGFLKRALTVGTETHNYRVYIPRGYKPDKKYPVVLYLHGGGETGDDNERQIGHGLGGAIQLFMWKYPERFGSFIAVFPQTKTYWIGGEAEAAVKALDQTINEFNGDAQRVYLTGFSLGGYGAWYLAAKYPKKFAAVAPVGGGILPPGIASADKIPPMFRLLVPAEMFAHYTAQDPYAAFAKAIGKTPTWVFHGAEDEEVSVTEARKMTAAFKATGNPAKYTEYAGEKHFVTDKVYTDAQFWQWLSAQRLVQ